MIIFKIFFLICFYFVCSGLTFHEASTFYGSNVLICSSPKEGEKTVRYWSLVKKYNKKDDSPPTDMILDLISKKSYPIGNCSAFKCSPEPWRTKGCVLK